MTYEGVPGLVETREAYGETTLVVDAAHIAEACAALRETHGFSMLVDISPVDYLGWGTKGVAGYIGTSAGRDIFGPGSQGFARTPAPKPARFCISYHLLSLDEEPARVRVQAWLDDGAAIDSVIGIWPAADWYEREAFDMFGVTFRGHPNLVRILMPDDWDGHPLRKDYPVGGEPVRFSGEE